jgi:ATP-binding cassette, subfamily A (ABC1), member 3
MEEADVLGDKIAIMENGELLAYGTSMYLKKAYGNGYTLKMLKTDKNRFNVGKPLELIREIIPEAHIKVSV